MTTPEHPQSAGRGEGREHEWELEDAGYLGHGVLELDWRCENCGKGWGTVSGITTMPNEEAGECER